MRRFFTVVTVAALVGAALSLTAFRLRAARAPWPGPGLWSHTKTKTVTPNNPGGPAPPAPLNPGLAVGESYSAKLDFPGLADGEEYFSPIPGVINVHAHAEFDNTKGIGPDALYYWRLDVLRVGVPADDYEILWSHDYDRAEFPVRAGDHVQRDFRENLQMPPGRYLVRVWLMDVMWDLDADGMPALVSTREDGVPGGPMSSFWAEVR